MEGKLNIDKKAGGLSKAEAEERLAEYGYNEIKEEKHSTIQGTLKRLWGPIPWILEAAILLELILGKWVEASIIFVLLVFSALVGETNELRAKTALGYLRSHLQVTARVRRDAYWQFMPARELVPGDEIRVKMGDIIPADCTINDGTVEVDQSVLTGESAAVTRTNGEIIYSGSTVCRGEATGTVTATGKKSYYGKTAELVRTAKSPGHLEQLLFTVVRYLAYIDAMLTVVLIGSALWNQSDLIQLIPFVIVLVIATIPVSMPASFTVANALEARRLAKEGALVTGLTAIQEAATMEVLCVDKTGTLTQNRQTIYTLAPFSGESEDDVLSWAAAASDESTQNPLDMAILNEAKQRSLHEIRRKKFIPFDPATKYSEAYIDWEGQPLNVVMGSPMVLEKLAEPMPKLMEYVEELSTSGARVLAVAAGSENHLKLRGLVALADAPREDAEALVKALHGLSIRVMMITGDTPATAQAVCHQVGLGDRIGDLDATLKDPLMYDCAANIYPEDKFRIVQALQRAHLVTGMTGDGINDAPALRQAEVGIAVSSASDVAKASAKVVMTRPGLQDIINVVSGGRRVYRRMLTWTITKIARTVELAALLTIGYVMTGIFVVPLFLIVLIVVLNDLVTLTLGTDQAWVSPVPERWNVGEIAKIAGILAAGWLALAFAMLWIFLNVLNLLVSQIQTLMFIYLIYSAQATIYMTRIRDHFWSFAPSRYVIAVTVGDMVFVSAIAILGIFMAAVPVAFVLGVFGAVFSATFLLDEVKIWFFKKTGILGGPINEKIETGAS